MAQIAVPLVGAAIGGAAGFVLSGGNPMGAFMGAEFGYSAGSALMKGEAGAKNAAAGAATTGTSGATQPGQPETTSTTAAGGNTPGATTNVAPSGADIATETAVLQASQTAEYQQKAEEELGGMKVAEAGKLSAIKAAAAARGFKINEGTPEMALKSETERANIGMGIAGQEMTAGVAQQKAASVVDWNRFLLTGERANLNAQIQTSNAWVSAFTGVINTSTQLLGFWNPSVGMGSNAAEWSPEGGGYQYQPGYGWGYGGY